MSLQGTLFFNKFSSSFVSDKTTIRGEGNQHDESKGVDLKIGDEFIKNGIDNFFPFDIEETVKRSMLQKRAFRTITNIIDGELFFENYDGSAISPQKQLENKEKYKQVGITKHGFIGECVRSNYLQGGSFQTLQFISNGRQFVLGNVKNRLYKTARLSFPTWYEDGYFSDKHYYHRNWGYMYQKKSRKQTVSKSTLSWLDWNKDPKVNFDNPLFIYTYHKDRDLRDEVNRLQSHMIGDFDGLSDYYPTPVWFSGTTYNYERAEFFLSCFDVDDIQNGMHASGIVKVYNEAYTDPESGIAIDTFERDIKNIESKLKGSYNSGTVVVIPSAIDSEGKFVPTNGYMEFEPFQTNSNKDRHDNFDLRIMNKILGANGVIMPEILGIRDEKSTLSESGNKLINAVKLLNQFTVKPQIALLSDPESGFLNSVINPLLGIEEKTVLIPNMRAFLNISSDLAKHYLHPDQWYQTMQDFGLSRPTLEQIDSGLIPAYNTIQRISEINIK